MWFSWDWFKSRVFWGTLLAALPEIFEKAGFVIAPGLGAIIQFLGVLLGLMGFRGAVLRAGGLKG